MSLITAHRILIGTAVVFFAFYGAWELVGFGSSGEAGALLRGIVALAVAGTFGAYFRTIRERYRRRDEGRRTRGER
jgi:hypothetical protein